MSATSRTDSVTPARAAPAGVPSLDVDPFSNEFFEDPHAIHDTLREAGPLVWLDKWGVYGVARYAEVHAVLNDPLTFCSSRGVGLSDFAKEKPWRPQSIILEADPAGAYADARGAGPGAVADGDERGPRPFH